MFYHYIDNAAIRRNANNTGRIARTLDNALNTHRNEQDAYTFFRCPKCNSVSAYRCSPYFIVGMCRGRYCGHNLDEKNVIAVSKDTVIEYGMKDCVKAIAAGKSLTDEYIRAQRPKLFEPSDYYTALHEYMENKKKETKQ